MADANPAVIADIQDLNYGFFRQLTCEGTSTPWGEAVDALAPQCGFMGAPGKPSDDEPTIRGQVTALAASTRSKYLAALLGVNEPNGADGSWDLTSAQNTVKRQYWIWDQAHIETWPHRGGVRPPIYSPALKINGSGAWDPDGHRYDDDVALLASATYNPGSGALHLGDVIDKIDHHQYDGDNGPGARVNGKDSYGHLPPSLILGADGKCSRVDWNIALAQQLAPGKPVGLRSEFGWEEQTGTAQHALFAQETFLRLYQRGCMGAIYETIDEGPSNPNGSGNWFGLTNLTDGPKPIYAALKTLWTYQGSASFSGVGWIEPLAGVAPDCGCIVFSKVAGGWDVYLLTEAVTAVDFVTAPGHAVSGMSPDHTDSWGNRHYTVALSSTMIVLQVT